MPAIDFVIHVHGKNYLTYTENQVRVHVFLAMLPTCLCDESKTTDELTIYCCFVTFIIIIDKGATLNLLQCLRSVLFVDVEPYRLTVLRHHRYCCIKICSYYHNIISSGSPPVFHECTSSLRFLN